MGTYGGYTSRNELVAEVTKSWETEHFTQVAEKKFFSGNNLWVLFAKQSKHSSTDVERFIVLFKISRWGANDWAYKPISEDMGPYDYTCPLSFLDAAQHPHPNGYPEGWSDWRAAVRAYHARKFQKLVVGQVVKLTNAIEYRITQVGHKVMGVSLKDGLLYRIPRKMLTATEAQ